MWRLRAGRLAPDPQPVRVRFSGMPPSVRAGSSLFSDGVSAPAADGVGLLLMVVASWRPPPPPSLTAACRALLPRLCPGVEVHGPACDACVAAHAPQLADAGCPTSNLSYAWYCAEGTTLPDMVFYSMDGLAWAFRGALATPMVPHLGGENALLRLGDGTLMVVFRYDWTQAPAIEGRC